MPRMKWQWIMMMIVSLVGCTSLPQSATQTPTRVFSAPTLAPSPTTNIQTSEELFGNNDVAGQNNPTAAALPNVGALPPRPLSTREPGGAQSVQLVLDNGEILIGDMYSDDASVVRVPGILMLAQDRLSWGLLPVELLSAGYTVLVVDLPDSRRVADLEVLLTSLSEDGSVDPARIAVIAAGDGADFALLGCATVPICDAVVMLSPQNRNTLLNVLPNFSPRPIFVSAGEDDPESFAAALALSGAGAEGSGFVTYPSGRGTALLDINADLTQRILDWLAGVLSL